MVNEKELGKTLKWGGADHLFRNSKLKSSVDSLFPRAGKDIIDAAREADVERIRKTREAKKNIKN